VTVEEKALFNGKNQSNRFLGEKLDFLSRKKLDFFLKKLEIR